MDVLLLVGFVLALVLFAVLAIRFGHDSRDGLTTPPQPPLWHRP